MDINPQTEIGHKLLAYLKQNPTTINKLGRKIGVGPMTLKKILEGQKRIRMDIIFTLEKFFNQEAS